MPKRNASEICTGTAEILANPAKNPATAKREFSLANCFYNATPWIGIGIAGYGLGPSGAALTSFALCFLKHTAAKSWRNKLRAPTAPAPHTKRWVVGGVLSGLAFLVTCDRTAYPIINAMADNDRMAISQITPERRTMQVCSNYVRPSGWEWTHYNGTTCSEIEAVRFHPAPMNRSGANCFEGYRNIIIYDAGYYGKANGRQTTMLFMRYCPPDVNRPVSYENAATFVGAYDSLALTAPHFQNVIGTTLPAYKLPRRILELLSR